MHAHVAIKLTILSYSSYPRIRKFSLLNVILQFFSFLSDSFEKNSIFKYRKLEIKRAKMA